MKHVVVLFTILSCASASSAMEKTASSVEKQIITKRYTYHEDEIGDPNWYPHEEPTFTHLSEENIHEFNKLFGTYIEDNDSMAIKIAIENTYGEYGHDDTIHGNGGKVWQFLKHGVPFDLAFNDAFTLETSTHKYCFTKSQHEKRDVVSLMMLPTVTKFYTYAYAEWSGDHSIKYLAVQTVEEFNKIFHRRNCLIHESIPFLDIKIHHKNPDADRREGNRIRGYYGLWNFALRGAPLSLLEQETFTLMAYERRYCFKKYPQEKRDLATIMRLFKKNPFYTAPDDALNFKEFRGNLTMWSYWGKEIHMKPYIKDLCKKGIIEKDGDRYKHGPRSYVITQQHKREHAALVATRIINLIANNKASGTLEVLKQLSREQK